MKITALHLFILFVSTFYQAQNNSINEDVSSTHSNNILNIKPIYTNELFPKNINTGQLTTPPSSKRFDTYIWTSNTIETAYTNTSANILSAIGTPVHSDFVLPPLDSEKN